MTDTKKELLELISWLETTKTAWFFVAMVMFVINLISVPYAILYILKFGLGG